MTLLKDNNYKDINIALLSLESDIKKLANFDTSAIDKQLVEINERIDEINKFIPTGGVKYPISKFAKNIIPRCIKSTLY